MRPRYLIDTDFLSLFILGQPAAVRNVVLHLVDDVVTSVITAEEVLAGRSGCLRRMRSPADLVEAYRLFAETVQELSFWRIAPFSAVAFQRYEALKRMKLNIGGNDLRIAAIALEEQRTLVTRNARDFGRVPGLALEDWS